MLLLGTLETLIFYACCALLILGFCTSIRAFTVTIVKEMRRIWQDSDPNA